MNRSAPNPRSGLTLRANFSWTFAGNVIHTGCWWGMTVVLAKLGSPEMLGQYALGLAITAPVFMFASLRLRDVQATDAKQTHLFGDYFALRLTATTLALLVVVGIVSVSGFQWEMAAVILAVGAAKAIEAISDVFYGRFMQDERMDLVAKSMMMKGPLLLIGLGMGVYMTGSVYWGVVGLAISRLVILLGYDIRNATLSLNPSSKLSRGTILQELPRPRWNARALARLAWLALPLGFVTMLISFNSNIPRYFIEEHLGAYQLGIFAAIASFKKASPTLMTALGRSASQRLARYYAVNNTRGFRKLMLKLVGISVVLGGAGILVALVVGRELLTFFYGAEYALPGLLVLVMIAAGIDAIATMLQFGMTAARYFKAQLPVFLVTTGAVAIASFLLIPSAGLRGAAIALVISALIRVGGSLIAVWHALAALRKDSISFVSQTSAYELQDCKSKG